MDDDENRKRLELLRQARLLLSREAVDLRMQQHQQWIRDSESTWRTNGSLLPYPTSQIYPSEAEVVTRALALYNQANQVFPVVADALPIQDDQPPAVTAQLIDVYNQADMPTEDPVIETPWKTILTPEVPTQTLSETVEDSPVAIPDTEEPDQTPVEEPAAEEVPEDTIPIPALYEAQAQEKHSLLRNVLSGWLQKNKDKET